MSNENLPVGLVLSKYIQYERVFTSIYSWRYIVVVPGILLAKETVVSYVRQSDACGRVHLTY